MKVIETEGYVLEVDVGKTAEYYASHALEKGSIYRNFYKQIKGKFPNLEAFLTGLGVDIARPDDTICLDVDDGIAYNPRYSVTGRIRQMENDAGLLIDGIHVEISKGDTPYDEIENQQTEPYFVLSLSLIYLPWVLKSGHPGRPSLLTRLLPKIRRKRGWFLRPAGKPAEKKQAPWTERAHDLFGK